MIYLSTAKQNIENDCLIKTNSYIIFDRYVEADQIPDGSLKSCKDVNEESFTPDVEDDMYLVQKRLINVSLRGQDGTGQMEKMNRQTDFSRKYYSTQV